MAIVNRKYQNNSLPFNCATAMIITMLAHFILSVDGLRCHQCNSHLNEDCIELRLKTPHAPRDDQFLRECDGSYDSNAMPFCRKTVVEIAVNGERRIVRSCGWKQETFKSMNYTCYDADNEGFMQRICSCSDDGCNAAPGLLNVLAHAKLLSMAGIVLITLGSLLSRH